MSNNKIAINKVAVIGQPGENCEWPMWFEDDIYGIVERKHLEQILDDKGAMSGLILDESNFADAGCLAGAQGTVLVSYGCIDNQNKLQICFELLTEWYRVTEVDNLLSRPNYF